MGENTLKKLSAHQPAYLPWLGLFEKINKADCFIIMDDVQFEKNSFINRNNIKTPQGETLLTVPVLMKGHINKTIRDIEINNTVKWRKKHWMSIYLNYKNTKYFSMFSDFFEDMYNREWNNLNKLLKHQMGYLLNELKIDTEILELNTFNLTSKKQDLIIDMCKSVNADKFIFGKLGSEYVDEDLFDTNNIQREYQNYNHPTYNQVGDNFISNMSVIDLLFNEGSDNSLNIIMGE